jgi:cellulose synthase/poly-beta-1,6-N-acetylglucosamine synthase-like glycosyltransferase
MRSHKRGPGVSVVIPTVDRPAELNRALAAVARAAHNVDGPVEAIVVDDSDPSNPNLSLGASVEGMPVRLVRTADEGVRGPAAARNLGVSVASYDLIAFTDDDAHCDQRWLEIGVARLRAEPTLAGVEGAVRVDLERAIDPVRSRIVMNDRGGGYLTASLFARAAAIESVGGFRRLRVDGDGWAIPYREDTDLGLRLVKRVGQVPFVPEAFVLHPAEPTDVRRLVRLGRYFIVDGAFARLHPEAVPSLNIRPFSRVRIRLATALTLITPLLAFERTRRIAATSIVLLGVGVSAQFEIELRAAGVRRGPLPMVLDTTRRLPRMLMWSLAAGSARLQGEALVALRMVELPREGVDSVVRGL